MRQLSISLSVLSFSVALFCAAPVAAQNTLQADYTVNVPGVGFKSDLKQARTGPIQTGNSLSASSATSSASGQAFARTDFGTLQASISSSASATGGGPTGPGEGFIFDTKAYAYFLDNVTFRPLTPSLIGQRVTVNASLLVNGSQIVTADGSSAGGSQGYARASIFGSTGVADPNIPGLPNSDDIAGADRFIHFGALETDPRSLYNIAAPTVIPVQFTTILGGNMSLNYTLTLFGRSSATVFRNSPSTESASSSMSANYTIRWGGISSVTDSNGVPLPDFTAIGASGFDYRRPAANVAAPEPGSFALVVLGLSAIVVFARGRTVSAGEASLPRARRKGTQCNA